MDPVTTALAIKIGIIAGSLILGTFMIITSPRKSDSDTITGFPFRASKTF